MAPSNKVAVTPRVEKVRKATGHSTKSAKLPSLVSVGQSQQINALKGKSNLTDAKVKLLENSLRKQIETISDMIALATTRQEDYTSRLQGFEIRTGEVEKRQKVLAQTLDHNFAAISRDLDHIRSTFEDYRCTWDKEGLAYRKTLESMKLDSEEHHRTNRENIQQVQAQYCDMHDTIQSLKADIADGTIRGGKRVTTKPSESLQTDQRHTEGVPTPEETKHVPEYIKHPPKAIRRFLRQFDRHQDAYNAKKPLNEEDFLWGFLGQLHPLVAEFLQETLVKRCPQYVTVRNKQSNPHPRSGVVPIIALKGITGKPLTGEVFFRALDGMDMTFISMELMRSERGEV
ncbi:hypothetical protein PG984_001007 [Apiospora sp. TS-2023a]